MNFRARIWMLPASAASLFIIGSALSYAIGARTSAALEHMRQVDYPFLEAVAKVDRSLEQFRLALQSAAAEGDEPKLKEVEALGARTMAEVGALKAFEGRTEAASALQEAFDVYQTAALGASRAMLGKGQMGDKLTRMQSSMVVLDKMRAESQQSAVDAVAQSQQAVATGVQRNLWAGLCTGAAVLLVLGLASRYVVSSVWGELGAEPSVLRDAVQRIADGDLTLSDRSVNGAQPGSLGAAVASMSTKLHEAVGQIREASDSIATASGEIASGNHDLSSRTEHAATSLRQAAGSMLELAGTVRESADSASQANQLAHAAAGAARHGGGIVSQVVANMNEINAASRKITEIIGVIDGIAFQTNILALNAAVEAARAGDQGRGFAVVAAEVRSLAQRCTQAAKEIKTLIGLSSDKVDSGAKLVQDAGGAMHEIVAGVQRVSDIIGEMSAATTQQSTGIGSITDSVGQLDQMTQQNAALVEESAVAAGSLREQAELLAQVVRRFKLQDVLPEPVAG